MDNDSNVSEETTNIDNSTSDTSFNNESSTGNGSGTTNTYDGKDNFHNNLARRIDGLSNGINNLSNRLKTRGNKFNNRGNKALEKNPNSKLGNVSNKVGNGLNKAGNRLGGISKGLNKVNKGVQTANNAANMAEDPTGTATSIIEDKAASGVKDAVGQVTKTATRTVTRSALLSVLPIILIILLILICIFIAATLVLGLFDSGSNIGGYAVKYSSECNFEETMVTVMNDAKTEIYETSILEDYVIGVACPEIGACDGAVASKNREELKANYVAIKTYVLTRWLQYNSSTKSVVIRASTNDQMWCSLKNGCYPYSGRSYPGNYDKSLIPSKAKKRVFTEEDLKVAHEVYKEIYGILYLPPSYNGVITTFSSGSQVGYKSKTQEFWEEQAAAGKRYDEILKATATSGRPDAGSYANKQIYNLANYCVDTHTTGNLQALESYPVNFISKSNKKAINSNIVTLLGKDGVSEVNNYIISSVNKSGYGTGDGVAAAGQSLVYGLFQKGYYLPYSWGGGHTDKAIGIKESWGNYKPTYSEKFHMSFLYDSMDCSGFVSWSIRNGCNSDFDSTTAHGYTSFGRKINLKDAKPGDLMANSNHVRLIIKNTGTSVIVAESEFGGISFREYSSSGNYNIIDMSSWYSKNCKSSR